MYTAHKSFQSVSCSHLLLLYLRVEVCKRLSPSSRLGEIDSSLRVWQSLIRTWMSPGSIAPSGVVGQEGLFTWSGGLEWSEKDSVGQQCTSQGSKGELHACLSFKVLGRSYEQVQMGTEQGKEINFTGYGGLLLLGVAQDAQIFTYRMASQGGLEHCFKVGWTFFKSHCFFLGKGLLPKAPLDTMLSTLTKTQTNQHKPPHLKGEGAARCEQAQDQKARAIFFGGGGICLSLCLQVCSQS